MGSSEALDIKCTSDFVAGSWGPSGHPEMEGLHHPILFQQYPCFLPLSFYWDSASAKHISHQNTAKNSQTLSQIARQKEAMRSVGKYQKDIFTYKQHIQYKATLLLVQIMQDSFLNTLYNDAKNLRKRPNKDPNDYCLKISRLCQRYIKTKILITSLKSQFTQITKNVLSQLRS